MSGLRRLRLRMAVSWQPLLLTHWQNGWLYRLVAWIYWPTKQRGWLTGLATIWPCAGSVSESSHRPTDRKQDPLITGSILHQQRVGHSRHTSQLAVVQHCINPPVLNNMWSKVCGHLCPLPLVWGWLTGLAPHFHQEAPRRLKTRCLSACIWNWETNAACCV